MAKEIDKIIQSKTAPKSNNVLWDDGENLKINRNGKWESTNTTEIKDNGIPDINPVIWKYMCNPHIVECDLDSGSCFNPIPKELSDIIYQNNKFNPLVLSTVLIKVYSENSNGWSVERITSYNEDGNIIFCNAPYVYNPNTRLFVI